MYKRASDAEQSIHRTASHSTKPYGGGKVLVLPPEAKPAEQIFLDLNGRVTSLVAQLRHVRATIATMKAQWRQRPYQDGYFVKLKELEDVESELNGNLVKLKHLAIAAATEAYAVTFMYMAEAILPTVVFMEIEHATQKLMGHGRIGWKRKRWPAVETRGDRGRGDGSD